ncbi:MAG TPA: hypothetical protein PLZ58_00100 [Candidatus Saccharibacteria bacterium]|nr:hypothetical protein [Candidatus Saccharibacteria bacterium]HRQ07277.1 hypothetical protein [Candidatus Saccharibacteria bacterium]
MSEKMIKIEKFETDLSIKPSFEAHEYSLLDVTIEDLASGIGRFAIFKSLIEHQKSEDLVIENQVWAGINGISLIKNRTLFSQLNSAANPSRLNRHFNATGIAHWRDVIGEAKYSPFTYIYKGYLPEKYPTIVGFDLTKISAAHPGDSENIDWAPIEGETTESALSSIYYFSSLFPKSTDK